MLEIKKITKIYETGGFKQKALDEVSLNFRECEFASILGPSGSGKTTLLNIIGGLDHYTSGDLVINEISTKKFKDSDWDSYRNHRIGFVFQSYNLISHQTILANVMLALTLSGINKKEAERRAKKALKDVGLEKHINKKPTELSGGQMQRVAIARALVNDPEILLADEPTGALDSETSVQIMNLLKNIAKDKLVIMVTHNPDLAKEYSNRIITLKDGHITSDSNPYDGKINTKDSLEENKQKGKKTSMSFKTALSLSFNNLMTKKGRTILVAFAGSIGIIGIALIMAVSTGFQNYVDSISEDTLTSYPLSIMEESTDLTSMFLSMTTGSSENDESNTVREQQYISSMLSSVRANDLKSFKNYLETNYGKIKDDISTIKYSYSIDPLIYTIDAKKNLSKVNPSNLFSSIYGGSSMLSSYSSLASIYSQMIDNEDTLKEQYDVLAGRWPKEYNEMILVLSEPNTISDLLVYSLGLKDTNELNEMVSNIMSGKEITVKSEALTISYEDLLNIDLRLIMPSDTYKYNKKYKVYEDMSTDNKYMEDLYNKSTKLKIVGIVTAKEGVTSTALSPGVGYTSKLIDYIIDYSKKSEIVKKQLENENVDVFSNTKFNAQKNNYNFKFTDLVSIDEKKLASVFSMKVNPADLQKMSEGYMVDISNLISTDTTKAYNDFISAANTLGNGILAGVDESFSEEDINSLITDYLKNDISKEIFNKLNKDYYIPTAAFETPFNGLLNYLLQMYIQTYNVSKDYLSIDEIKTTVLNTYKESTILASSASSFAPLMSESAMKASVLTKVGELTGQITSAMASSLKVDEAKFAECFKLNFTEDELTRVVSAMMNPVEKNAYTNLISLGYQDKEKPSYISFYFNTFDGKEDFLSFIDEYNKEMENQGYDEKVIKYSDTTGILMGSVKTIVNAVSYVLIAFVSISLVVSSIMIGIITYISVYERTKEIGILRAIGASKRNISSIFNAETFIIGLLSGLFGIGISYALIPVINLILHHYTGNIPLAASLAIIDALKLIVLSVILTLIGGLIPAKSASKKDPVVALRSE